MVWVSIRIVPRVMDTVMERDVWRMKIKRSSPVLKKARIKLIKARIKLIIWSYDHQDYF